MHEPTFRLATPADAPAIAALSRDLIESGLGWSWTPMRVARNIRDRDTVVVAAGAPDRMAGFAIMYFAMEEAHLTLLAVRPDRRRAGLGSRLVRWLEASALTAGIGIVHLEARASNAGARAFYERLGYRCVERLHGYYRGREDALHMTHDLWAPSTDGRRSAPQPPRA
ncbi:MAG: GNAT family N-acetyltransferase [Gammaproteobacteria bacterium]